MSLRSAALFSFLLILSHGVPAAAFAQEEEGVKIEGPFEGFLAAPVEMNSDLRDLPSEVPLRRGEGPIADLDGRPPRAQQLVADLAGRPQHVSAPAPFIRHIDGDYGEAWTGWRYLSFM